MMRTVALSLLLTALSTTVAQGASIVLLSAQSDSCLLISNPPEPATFDVVVLDVGAIPNCPGMIGAAFRVDGLPSGWTATAVLASPSEVGSVTGDLFGDGVWLYFWQPCLANFAPLFEVTLVPPTPGAQAVLRARGVIPSEPGYPCPVAIHQDCLFHPVDCVDRGALYVNVPGHCGVAVDPSTWAEVKVLYH
jgi:hypothetical protein